MKNTGNRKFKMKNNGNRRFKMKNTGNRRFKPAIFFNLDKRTWPEIIQLCITFHPVFSHCDVLQNTVSCHII